jgi:uncharacterized protein
LKKRKTTLLLSLVFLLLFFVAACGKKAAPVPKGQPFPAPVADLSGVVKDGVLFLSFSIPSRNQDGTPLTNLAGFKIQKVCGTCIGGFEPFKDVRLADTHGYTTVGGRLWVYDHELRPGFEYVYRVIPYLENGVYSDPSNLYAIKWQTPPEPPQGVKATPGDGSVQLTWTAQNDRLYNVYRFEGELYPLSPLNDKPLLADGFTDRALQNGKSYRYEVRALIVDGGIHREGEGVSVAASPVDKTPPVPPKELTATKKNGAVSLAWTPSPDADVSGYNVYRLDGGDTVKVNPLPTKEATYLDSNPGEKRYVSYFVTAVDNSGNESESSREAVIILKPKE